MMTFKNRSERDEVQGARSAENETYQMDKRVDEHRVTQQFRPRSRFVEVVTC